MIPDLPGLVQQIAHFENRLASDSGSRVFLPLADLYRRAGKLEDARRILVEGLDQHPNFVTARAALGLVLSELGDAAAAREALNAVLQIDPDNVLALRLLGREAVERSAWPEACEHFERLLRLEPEDRDVRDGLREARRQLDQMTPMEPEPVVMTAARPGPMTPHSVAVADDAMGFETPTLAELYLRQGHPEKARVILERILASEPQRQDALAILARLENVAEVPPVAAAAAEESAAAMPLRVAAASQPQGRGEELDRFRAWLDAASDDHA